nr:MAG TPA: hypothetical protein [Caudoviricetes sp.]
MRIIVPTFFVSIGFFVSSSFTIDFTFNNTFSPIFVNT